MGAGHHSWAIIFVCGRLSSFVGDSGDAVAVVGVGDGGGWNGSTVCLLTTTN